MPVRVIGMIGVTPPGGEATVHIIKGGISAPYLRSYAQAHDKAGFDLALVGYTASSAEGFLVAQYAAQHTERLGYLIAHRPGFVAPTLAARKIATFDHLTDGRIAIHIISGASDAEQENDGDFAPKEVRYRRAGEYIEVMKLAWTSSKRFDFDGEFFQVEGATTREIPDPLPEIYFGGASESAEAVAAEHVDVYLAWGEPPAMVAERVERMRALAATAGRTLALGIRFHVIARPTADEAWAAANALVDAMDPADIAEAQRAARNWLAAG